MDKNGDGVGAGIFDAGGQAAADGGRFLYAVPNGIGDAEVSGLFSGTLATQGSSSWSSHVLNPFHVPLFIGPYSPDIVAASRDLTKSIWSTNADPVTRTARSREDLWLRDNLRDEWRLLTPDPAPGGAPYPSGTGYKAVTIVDLTADLGTILYETPAELTADAVALEDSPNKLYRWENGEVTLEGQVPNVLPGPGGETPAAVSAGGATIVDLNENFISDDGAVSYFTPTSGLELLYRRDRNGTVLASAEENSEEALPPDSVEFRAASADGSRAFFVSYQPLLAGDDPFSRDLYMYADGPDPASEANLTRLSVDAEPDDGTAADVAGVLGTSQDGHRVYFATEGQIVDGGPTAPAYKVFLWDDSSGEPVVKYVAGLDESGASALWGLVNGAERRRVDADGGRLMFISAQEGLGPAPTGDVPQAFLYDAAASTALEPRIDCLSCGAVGAADSEVTTQVSVFALGLGLERRRWLSADGTRAIFQTSSALLPRDTNQAQDVYMWDSGALHLISSGRSGSASTFLDADPAADNVFFQTREKLDGRDRDEAADVYVATTDGAFPAVATPAPECAGEDCQVPLASTGSGLRVGSNGYAGAGNVRSRRAKPRCAKPRKARAQAKGKRRCVKSRGAGARKANTNRRQGR